MGDRAHLGRQGDMRGLESGVKPFRKAKALRTAQSRMADPVSHLKRSALSTVSFSEKDFSAEISLRRNTHYLSNYVDQMSAKTRLKFPPRIFSTAALL